MSDAVVVFAPAARSAEDPLARTRWMAHHTIERLTAEGFVPAPVLDHNATRAGLEAAITASIRGVAFFSHGRSARVRSAPGEPMRDDAIVGADGPALDRDNMGILQGRWVHAIACHAGTELAAQACASGAACFIGYPVALIVDWNPDELPASVVPLMIALVTATTLGLARGVRDERALRRTVNEIAEEIARWCEENEEDAAGLGLEITAQQLTERLIMY